MGSNFLTGFNKDRQQVLFIKYPCSDNTYCPAVELNLDPGKYLFELWGARSGDDYYRTGYALGGYASGIIYLNERKKFYLNIGGVGSDGTGNGFGGNNGGGNGGSCGGGGGGATDIRLDDSLQSRIIVAGGAGGGELAARGHGGGIEGIGGGKQCGRYTMLSPSKPGTQISGGDAGIHQYYSGAEAGSFGKGGSGIIKKGDSGPGGGGGYFGGGGNPYVCDASGGSSYISGHPDCRSVSGPNETITTSNPIHYSGLRFFNPLTIAGNNTMPLPSLGFKQGVGNSESGAIRITILSYNTYKITRTSSCYSMFIIIIEISN